MHTVQLVTPIALNSWCYVYTAIYCISENIEQEQQKTLKQKTGPNTV